MAIKRWRIWSGWGLFCLALIGLGFALDASLPPQPRFVLRGGPGEGITAGALSTDGTILTTRSYLCGPDGEISAWQPLRSWDTFRGVERGEFFGGLIGAWGIRGQDDLDAAGFDTGRLIYSPDRRYCALVHREGLALADLQTGQEWPRAIAWKSAEYAPESVAVYRMLHQPIDTKVLREKAPLKVALEDLCANFEGKLKIVVARDLLDAKVDKDAPPILEEEVCLPEFPARLNAEVALRLLISQVAKGDATYQFRRGVVEIAASKPTRENTAGKPVFSPRGSFVALVEGGEETGKLHVVACASGQLTRTLAVPHEACEHFGFTPDERFIYFFADRRPAPLLTVWDLRHNQAARTFENVGVGPVDQFAPDGENLLMGNELLNLRTGQRRAMREMEEFSYHTAFSPDGQTLVSRTVEELLIWDVSSGQLRQRIKLDAQAWWSLLIVSADSRVVACATEYRSQSFAAWSLETGARLWPLPAPKREEPAQDENGAVQEVLEEGGLVSRADMSPRFTPDRRFLCEREKGRINFLDPATGEPRVSLVLDGLGENPAILAFTPDGRMMLSQWDSVARKAWFGADWIAKWWPAPTGRFVVSDVAAGQVQLRVNIDEPSASALLSEDGRTLMACRWHSDVSAISCWDVPGRPSPWLVIGIPLASACAGVLGRWWFARKRRVPLPAPTVS